MLPVSHCQNHACSLARNREIAPVKKQLFLETLKTERHFEWQAPFLWLSRKCSLLVPMCPGPRCSQCQCTTCSLCHGWVCWETAQGPDNTRTSVPKTQDSQEPTCKIHLGWNVGAGWWRRGPHPATAFEIARACPWHLCGLKCWCSHRPKTECFLTTWFLTRPHPSAIHVP